MGRVVGMWLSILKIDMPEMKILLEFYGVAFDYATLVEARPDQVIRRACVLAVARKMLVQNNILSLEEARQTTIQHHESGEPFLKLPGKSELRLHISISHSGLWVACLISSADKPAGIDLEDLSKKRNFLKLAKHFFSVEEYEYVHQFGEKAFYNLWTAKEAIAKLRGKGLSEVLRIKLCPPILEKTVMSLEGCEYRLERHIAQNYIYTIASIL